MRCSQARNAASWPALTREEISHTGVHEQQGAGDAGENTVGDAIGIIPPRMRSQVISGERGTRGFSKLSPSGQAPKRHLALS